MNSRPPAILLAFVMTRGIAPALAQDAQVPAAPPEAPVRAGGEDPLGAGKGLELTLEAAEALALQNNLGLKIEELSTEVSWYDLRGSWGFFDWNLAASAAVQDREFESTSVFGGSKESTQSASVDLTRQLETGGTFSAHFDTLNQKTDSTFAAQDTSTVDVVSFAYRQPLLRGAWREYATAAQRQADLDWKRQSEHEREIRHKLVKDVANAYWDLTLARAQLEVARSSLDLARAQLDQDKKRLDAGIGVQLDVYSADAEVANNEERVLAAEVRVRQAADTLKHFVFPTTDPAVWDTMLVPSTPLPDATRAEEVPDWTAALSTAVDRRPELRQRRIEIDQAALVKGLRDHERQGRLDLDLLGSSTGFDGDASRAFDSAVTYEFPTWRAALTYSIPLSNRTARFASKAAWAALRAARLRYDESEAVIAMEVREAVRQVRYQAEAIRAAQKSLDLAERLLAAEQEKDRAGVSTNFEVLRLQRDLTTAKNNERTTRVNFAKAMVALRAAQGLLPDAKQP